MDRKKIESILADFKQGALELDKAVEQIGGLPFSDLEFARLDTHRQLRLGFPEVILGQGKTAEQIISISERMLEKHDRILITRVEADKAETIMNSTTELKYDQTARILFKKPEEMEYDGIGPVAVITAGTADLPVAREAALSADLMGNQVIEICDVGVAGIHRLFGRLDELKKCTVLIVVAGMEGALASVVAGLVASPVVAVPTSIGYGASFGGVAALLGMLNSCAPGISVVNIDNGFGAAAMASAINHIKG